MIYLLIYSPLISITAIVWIDSIVAPDNILAPLARFCCRVLPDYLAKPLFKCSGCLSGWLAIVFYLSLCDRVDDIAFVIPFAFTTMFLTNFLTKYLNVYDE